MTSIIEERTQRKDEWCIWSEVSSKVILLVYSAMAMAMAIFAKIAICRVFLNLVIIIKSTII